MQGLFFRESAPDRRLSPYSEALADIAGDLWVPCTDYRSDLGGTMSATTVAATRAAMTTNAAV